MVWLYPAFLWALLTLLIPIAIHLFNFRRYKRVVFSNVKLLRQINRQTKSGNQLKKYLILASRLLAFSFLVFAFAQPVLLRKGQQLDSGRKYISIIVDNSYSMNLSGNEGQLLEAAKNRARAIVSSAGESDEFSIITSDLNPSLQHFQGKQSALENIDKIKISAGSHPLSDLLDVQKRLLKEKNGNRLAFCISDFQKNNSTVPSSIKDSTILQTWIRLPASEHDNISIDTCYLVSPIIQTGQNITLVSKISNYTGNPVENLTLELWIDDKPKGIANFNIEAYGSEKQNINFTLETGGNHKCVLKLPGDNIPLDDELFFSLSVNSNYRINVISDNGEKYANAVFSDNPGFLYKQESGGNINLSGFKNYDLIVLQGLGNIQSGLISELNKFTKNGGTLFVFPSEEKNSDESGLKSLCSSFGINISSEPTMSGIKVASLDLEHPIYKNIFEKNPGNPDLPSVSGYYDIQAPSGNSVMKLSNSLPFIHEMSVGKGRFIICASPLDMAYTNFQNHALFLPTMMKSAMLGSYRTTLYHSCGDLKNIMTGLPYLNETGIQLKSEKSTLMPEVINMGGEMALNTNGEIENAGHYELIDQKQDSILSYLAFNINRSESDTRTLDDESFSGAIEDLQIEGFEGSSEKLAAEFSKSQKGIGLWKWCIIFVLFFLLIEILLIRFFRNNAKLSA